MGSKPGRPYLLQTIGYPLCRLLPLASYDSSPVYFLASQSFSTQIPFSRNCHHSGTELLPYSSESESTRNEPFRSNSSKFSIPAACANELTSLRTPASTIQFRCCITFPYLGWKACWSLGRFKQRDGRRPHLHGVTQDTRRPVSSL
jgi:hypothetical protein